MAHSLKSILFAIASLTASSALAFHFFYTEPKQQRFDACLHTYNDAWAETFSGSGISPAGLCQKEISLELFMTLLEEKTRDVALRLKNQGVKLENIESASKIKQIVMKEIEAQLATR